MLKTKNQRVCFFLGILLTISGIAANAQNEANVWLTGTGKQLNFNSGNAEFQDFEGRYDAKSSICDADGNLILYTNGSQLRNGNHEILENGEMLHAENFHPLGNPIFIPYPGKNGIYILIYESVYYPPGTGGYKIQDKNILYAEIDVNARNGRGEVKSKGIKIHDDYHATPTIAGYCNNSYFWMVIDRNDNVTDVKRDRIYAYKIDKNGVNTSPVINDKYDFGNSNGYKFSPNGDKLFFVLAGNAYNGDNYLADFNFLTGKLYNFRYMGFQIFLAREFSPDSRFLYFFDRNRLIQLDARYISSNRVINSSVVIHTFASTQDVLSPGSDLQLGPDGKLYFLYFDTTDGQNKMGRINHPNKKGLDCVIEPDLWNAKNFSRFPDFVTSFFRDKHPEFIGEVYARAGDDCALCPGSSEILGDNTEVNAFYHWYPEQNLNDPFVAQPVFTAPFRSVYAKTDTYTLRTTDGNCWLKFDEADVTQNPAPSPPEISGSWSVCPYVEEVDYWIQPKNNKIQWLVNGGRIVSGQGTGNIKVNWGETNFDASVGAFYVNSYECSSDTTWFPVRINVELLTETPNGPDELCIADAKNVNYQIQNTNGSVYDWTAHGGEIVSGQGTHRVVVNWLGEGEHALVVEETSTTIDTICYGESEPLPVTVINDSLDIQLENVSFNGENNVEMEYRSDKLTPHRHVLYIVSEGEETGRTTEENLSGWDEYDGTTLHFTGKQQLEPETIRLRVWNSCNETMWSNPLQTIVLKVLTVFGQQVRLAWNANRFWENNRVNYELWHAEGVPENWEQVAGNLDGFQLDYLNTGMELTHYFRIKATNNDEDKVSWSNRVKAELEEGIEIPDVFTPNGDGFNDKWEIRNIRFHALERATIYNRHGQKVFECRNEFVPWDGRQKGEIIQGTYFYELVFAEGSVKHGQVTVLQ